jgi:hypothetical protein
MCLICDHLDQNKLTPWEAAKNRSEMIQDLDEEHIKLLDDKIRFALNEYLNNLNNEEETNE